jgi:hypothetical protein
MNSGFNPKISNPNAILSQMTSGSFQAPFYFGASQVPVDLGINEMTGNGIHTTTNNRLKKIKIYKN